MCGSPLWSFFFDTLPRLKKNKTDRSAFWVLLSLANLLEGGRGGSCREQVGVRGGVTWLRVCPLSLAINLPLHGRWVFFLPQSCWQVRTPSVMAGTSCFNLLVQFLFVFIQREASFALPQTFRTLCESLLMVKWFRLKRVLIKCVLSKCVFFAFIIGDMLCTDISV